MAHDKKKHHHKKKHKKHRDRSSHSKSHRREHSKDNSETKTIEDSVLQEVVFGIEEKNHAAMDMIDDDSTDSATGQILVVNEVSESVNESLQDENSKKKLKKHKKSKHKKKSKESRSRDRRSRSRNRRSKSRDRMKSRDRRSKSRDRRSKSKDRRSKSRDRGSTRDRRPEAKDRTLRSRNRRSRSRDKRSRSRDRRSRSRNRRSRSKDRRSRSRNRRSRSRNRRSRSRSSLGTKDEEINQQYPPAPVIKTKADVIAEFTAFCHALSDGKQSTSEMELETHHPFKLASEDKKPQQYDPIVSMIMPSEAVLNIDTRPVEIRYPVSSGVHHQNDDIIIGDEIQSNESSLSVSDILVQRALIQQRLMINPLDADGLTQLKELDNKMSQWCQSQSILGRYTGVREVKPMDKSFHKIGPQAWAKKNMFHGLLPIQEGFGKKMLRKMGWEEGKPLGKCGKGHVAPIPVDVKVDRHGLSTEEDKGPVIPSTPLASAIPTHGNTPSCFVGKHPVSVLQELALKKHWDPPSYELVSETGPSHMKSYMYKVKVNNEIYQPVCGSNNKKTAKAESALTCLKALGIAANSN